MEPNENSNLEALGEQMGELSRLGSIFTEPTKTMADVAQRPTWTLALFLGLIFVAIPVFIQPTRVDPDAVIKAQVEQLQRFGVADEEQVEELVRAKSRGWWARYGAVVTVFGAGLIGAMALAGIVMLAYMMSGTYISFKNSLAASTWSGIPPTALLSGLAVLFLYVKPQEDLNGLDPFANVISNLSFLVSQKAQPVMHGFLGSFDIFSLWRIVLLGIGFAAISMGKLSVKKATTVVVVLWVLFLLIKTGISAIFA